ncbi:MAG: DUF4838 domain-containing protein [Planctomycetota bacterium]|nr:DUF4838 domain-containing protein [Planctomycetota bacterium]
MSRTKVACFLSCLILFFCHACTTAANDLNPVQVRRATKHQPVALVTDGKPTASIVVPATEGGSSRALTSAIRDLQTYIELTTGAKLEITDELNAKPAIVLGAGAAKLAGVSAEDLPLEGFIIKSAPDRVFIVGKDAAGTAWGIYEFLERCVGVRFYWPEYRDDRARAGTSIAKTKNLAVNPLHLTDSPAFRKRIRWPSGGPRIGAAKMTDHDRHLRCGSTWPVQLIVHAPHGWSKLYSKTRPEIFQLRKDGERTFSMLCYGHPNTLKTYLEEIELQVKGKATDRGRAIINEKSITVSPADMGVSCRCEYCRKLWNESGGSYGTASKVMATFVANLGREVKKQWPDMTVIFLPYKNYTYAPEGISFPDNVEVQICGMPGLARHKDKVIDAAEQQNIDNWVRITGRKIQNWHYSCWPANRTKAAYVYAHTIQKHYQKNRDKTVGSFINGVQDHWPRQHLSLYVWLKVLWNPDVNVDAIIHEYCTRMYGPAAKTMRELVRMLADGWEKSEWSPHVMSPKTVYEQSYPRAEVKKIEALLARAFEEAKDDKLVTQRLNYYAPALREFFDESKLLAEGTGIKPLNIYQIDEEVTIDGKLTEKAWAGIKPVSFVKVNKNKAAPKFPTELKAAWTRQGVTFGFKMMETDMANLKNDIGKDSRDASLIWWNDNVEIFLDPSGQRSGYFQFIVNPNGAVYDSIGRENTAWNPDGVKAAGHRDKDFWSVEIFVPYNIFKDLAGPATGVEWHGNFTRHRVTDRKNREYQGFNVTTGAPSHNQNAFGPLRFIER